MTDQLDLKFQSICNKARAAGLQAIRETTPTPVGLTDGVQNFIMADGLCGFAWIHISPGNCAFARWAKKAGIASKDYPSGMSIWVRDGGQSVTYKEAYAEAYAKVLKAGLQELDPSCHIYAASRLD